MPENDNQYTDHMAPNEDRFAAWRIKGMRQLKGLAFGVLFGALFAGPVAAIEPGAPTQLITRLDAVGLEVQKRLTASFSASSESEYEKNEHGSMVEYYAYHDHRPIWVNNSGLTDRARAAMKEISRAGDYGLNASDYILPGLENAVEGQTIPVNTLADAELKMNKAALAYVRDARGGRIPPQSISKNLDPTLNLADPLEVMEQFARLEDPSEYLKSFHPKNSQFEALRQVMLRIRGGSSMTEERIIVPNGPVLRPGQKHTQVALVRQRLKVPVPADSDAKAAETYDAELEAAVKKFQKSHGLNAEGIVGPATRRAMNGGAVPKNRLKTILSNMERWRWLPDDMGERHVHVNVPEFRVRVVENDKTLFSERVVVGKVKNATPIFSDEMEYVAFNPYWNVPNSIKVAELLPSLKRGGGGGGWFFNSPRPNILARHNLFVKHRGKKIDASSINWNNVDIRSYHFYQPPGGPNVLGDVKFMFPNKHSVYLHDTPTKSLFEKQVRAYSHGCIRVRNPRKLAEVLLGREGWSGGRINSVIETGKNTHVRLKKTIPVHLTYFTARVEKNGKITYFSDIYGYDARVASALKL
jgi:murein L,D-transpeptidase YcbB/YkuD